MPRMLPLGFVDADESFYYTVSFKFYDTTIRLVYAVVMEQVLVHTY